MDIRPYAFTVGEDTLELGLNISNDGSDYYVNLFDIGAGNSHLLGEHIWELAQSILDQVLQKHIKRSEAIWTLTRGDLVADIKFFEIFNQPYRFTISHSAVLNSFYPAYSLEGYQDYYSGLQPIHIPDDVQTAFKEPAGMPIDTYAVPCKSAKGGVFYCRSEFYNSLSHDDYEYFLADMEKLIQRIAEDDPETLRRASVDFSIKDTEYWLRNNGITRVYETGSFVINKSILPENELFEGVQFTRQSGDVNMPRLIQSLDLPFVPICIHKSCGVATIKIFKTGYWLHSAIKRVFQSISKPAWLIFLEILNFQHQAFQLVGIAFDQIRIVGQANIFNDCAAL